MKQFYYTFNFHPIQIGSEIVFFENKCYNSLLKLLQIIGLPSARNSPIFVGNDPLIEKLSFK